MTGRPTMDAELAVIRNRLKEMGALVETAVLNAVRALSDGDLELARSVVRGDEEIDELEDAIRSLCLRFMATQQPLAGDLRYAIAIMNVTRDLERIGDHGEDIAKYAQRFHGEKPIEELTGLPRMAEMSSKMMKNAIDSFLHRDLRLARRVWKSDEDVDEVFRGLFDKLLLVAQSDTAKTERGIMGLFVAAHLERIADYATNICEETVFVLEGEFSMEQEGF